MMLHLISLSAVFWSENSPTVPLPRRQAETSPAAPAEQILPVGSLDFVWQVEHHTCNTPQLTGPDSKGGAAQIWSTSDPFIRPDRPGATAPLGLDEGEVVFN